MATLSFTVKPKKQKIKFRFNKNNAFNILIVLSALIISATLCALVAVNNISYLSEINKPSFFVPPIIHAIISIIVYAITAPSLFFSLKYENNFKVLCGLSFASLLLNVLLFVSFFIFHSIAFSVLIVLSNLIICCYYFKKLNPKTLGTYLFIPYMVWLMFNVVLTYSIYLLN